jgi:23S rRNA pseudouridine1911/1915/1917 synthase
MQKRRWTIIHEDEDVLVVTKPPGMLTSTGPREKRPTLLAEVRAYVAEHAPRARVGLIHRLDRDAGGLLVFSKSHRAYLSLKRQFFEHTVDRHYLAVVHGTPKPPAGRIETRLAERADGTVYSVKTAGGEKAITDYQVFKSAGGLSLVRLKLFTGRKHQIRVHLSERGHPIVGDPMYGKPDDLPPLRLVAVEMAFDHPATGRRVKFKIDPPASLTALLRSD